MTVGWQPSSLTWCLPVGGSFCKFPLPIVGHLSKVPLFDSWESLTSQVSAAFWRIPPQSPISWGCLFPFFLLTLRASVLFPHPIPDQVPLFPPLLPTPSTFPPRSLPPSPLVIAFFSLPSGTEASWLGPFSLLSLLNSVITSIHCFLVQFPMKSFFLDLTKILVVVMK